jgi:hypothetical protein
VSSSSSAFSFAQEADVGTGVHITHGHTGIHMIYAGEGVLVLFLSFATRAFFFKRKIEKKKAPLSRLMPCVRDFISSPLYHHWSVRPRPSSWVLGVGRPNPRLPWLSTCPKGTKGRYTCVFNHVGSWLLPVALIGSERTRRWPW